MRRATIEQMARLVQLACTDMSDATRERNGVGQICFRSDENPEEIFYGMFSASFAFLTSYCASIAGSWPENHVAIGRIPNLQDMIERSAQVKRQKDGLFTLPEPVEFMPYREPKKSKENVRDLLKNSVFGDTFAIPGDLLRPVVNIVTAGKTIYLIGGDGIANWISATGEMPNAFFGVTAGITKLLETGCDGGIMFLDEGSPLVTLNWKKSGITGFVCPTVVSGVQDKYRFATKTKQFVIEQIKGVNFKELKEEGKMAQGEEGLDALKSLSVMNDFSEDDTDTLEEKKEELGKSIVTEKAAELKKLEPALEPAATWKVETTTAVEEPAPEEAPIEPVSPIQTILELSVQFAVLAKTLTGAAKAAAKYLKEQKAAQKKLDNLAAVQARAKELEARNKELEAKFENLKKLFQ